MHRRAELALLAVGLLCLVLFAALPLFFPDPVDLPTTYLKTLRYAAGTLYGASGTDIAQDIVGLRALAAGEDPYPVLGPALAQLGLDWDLDFPSPHLPTAYLFTAPIAALPWAAASALWALLMIAGWTLALHYLGASWNLSIGLGGLLLLWPPAAISLGQLTAPWLLFLALAYAWRARPGRSGAAIAIAALTKLTPALALVNFLRAPRRRQALIGFVIVWVLALAIVLSLNSSALARYWQVNQANTVSIMQRPDNAAPLAVAWRTLGWPGALAWLAFLALIVWRNWEKLVSNTVSGWMVSFYLAVAVLPVLWIYSLLPLLPVAWHTLRARGRLATGLTLAALALSFLAPPFGVTSVPLISASVVLLGAALLPAEAA